MKRFVRCLAVLAAVLAIAGCTLSPAREYVQADEATLEAVGMEYQKYVEEDPKLTPEQKDRRFRTLKAWKLRIEAAKK